jgi:Protein of unknown function (DUF3108)
MRRCLAICVILVFVVPVESAPKLKDLPDAAYFPMTVGDRWVTEMQYKTFSSEYTEVVTAVEKKDEATLVTIGREVEGTVGPQVSQIRITDKGIFRVSSLGTVYDAPYCVLRLPLKVGETWTSEVGSGGNVTSTFKYKAIKEEDVQVPAGKFRAFRIEVDLDNSGRAGRSTIWYAPQVGVVKMDHEDGDAGYVRTLKSFKAGGK